MKTVYICDLIGPALDWAVAKCEGDELAAKNIQYPELAKHYPKFSPSTDWAVGGPIVERENIEHSGAVGQPKHAQIYVGGYKWVDGHGPTFLVAAMRCLCHAKRGTQVEIPQELLSCQPPKN